MWLQFQAESTMIYISTSKLGMLYFISFFILPERHYHAADKLSEE